MSKDKKKKEENFLLYVPRKKHGKWEIREGKVYLIFEHKKRVDRFLRRLFRKPLTSDVELDELGSAVWQLIDGERTVYVIGQELLSKFGEDCQPVYDRLIMYLKYLNNKAWIALERGIQN